jgi:MFS family permease
MREVYQPVSRTTAEEGPGKQTGWRSKVLALICCLTFGVYYAYDLPAALPDQFLELAGGSVIKYELLYSAYALPNIITPIFMGTLADTMLGPHLCTISTCVLVSLGGVLVAAGVQVSH